MNKTISIILIVFALLIGFNTFLVLQPRGNVLGGSTNGDWNVGEDLTVTGESTFYGTSTHSGGATIGERTFYTEAGTLALGDAQDCIVFNKAAVGYFDYAEAYINGTASTTLELNVATSSSATLGQDANPYAELIDSYLVSTSTKNKLINSEENQGTNGVSAIAVARGTYVCIGLTDPYNVDGSCTGSLCENATSTARGYTVPYTLKFHY